MVPAWHYWIAWEAIFLPLSFAITFFVGILPMRRDENRPFVALLCFLAVMVTLLAWWLGARQEAKSYEEAQKRGAVEASLKDVQDQLAGLVVKMNRAIPVLNQELIVLSAAAPEWLKIAHKELGEREIPGPQENPRIVGYFQSVAAKKNYQDDIDDWASAFVEWSLNQAGTKGPKSDDPFAWLGWGRALDKPVLGCVVVMSFSGLRHVGFYFGEDQDFVLVLGGNQDDAVHIFRYPKNSVQGYRWPADVPIPNGH